MPQPSNNYIQRDIIDGEVFLINMNFPTNQNDIFLFFLFLKMLLIFGCACIVDFLIRSLNLNSTGVSYNSGKYSKATVTSSRILSGIILFSKLMFCENDIQ